MAKKHKRRHRKQPKTDDEPWVEYGDEMIWAVGFTAGGAPYGLTEDEYHEAVIDTPSVPGRVRARHIMERVFDPEQDLGGGTLRLGRPRFLGEGLERKAWHVDVELSPDPLRLSGPHVVLLPQHWMESDSDLDARVRREVAVLNRLSALELPFTVPRVVALLTEQGRAVVVETELSGMPLDELAASQQRRRPWPVIAGLAQAIHCLDTSLLDHLPTAAVPGWPTRRAHALAAIAVLDGLHDPVAIAARDWALAHLPADTPATLIHGDLLGQNILVDPFGDDSPHGIIDWSQLSRGDPAYDLAIVTRGIRRPFKSGSGLERLVKSYCEAGGELTVAEVRVQEIGLIGLWYRQSLQDDYAADPPEQALNRLRGLLNRVGA